MYKGILFLLFMPLLSSAANYYLSNSGNDANTGQSPQQAWKTISKLNQQAAQLQPGDSVLFKRGDSFYGSVRVVQNGATHLPIVFSAYGTGANPVITGFTTLKNWMNVQPGIWQAPAGMLKPGLNMVTIDGIPQRIGRYPNIDAADGGFLRYEGFDSNRSITDDELDNSINWQGAEVVIRKNLWTAERCRVLRQQGKTIYYSYANEGINAGKLPPLYSGYKGYGYFFQNDLRTLDRFGEWVLDSNAQRLLLFFGKKKPEDYVVQASSIDTLVDLGNHTNIHIEQLDFEGANRSGIFARVAADLTIRHCNFRCMGAKAIHIWNSPNVEIDHVSINYALSNAIQVRNSTQPNVSVTNCVIRNTGTYLGMGSYFDDRDYKALSASAGTNLTIANNRIDSTGLSAIQFQGSNATIRHNVVNYYCFLLDDGGGIYTYAEVSKDQPVLYANRLIEANIILNGVGAAAGSVTGGKAEGIYLDGGTMNVEVRNNSIANVVNKAIATNNPSHVTIAGNTCFNTGGGWGATRLNAWERLQTFNVTDNIFYAVDDAQRMANFTHSGLDQPTPVTIWEAIGRMGTIDRNYYNAPNPVSFNITYAPKSGEPYMSLSPLSLENWQEQTKQDLHSKRPSLVVPRYVLNATIGSNLVKQGDFSTNINGVIPFGRNMQAQWNDGKRMGTKGSMKINFAQPQANRFGLVHAPVGLVKAGKKYLLRFKILGATRQGIVKAYLRKTGAPFNNLVPAQVQAFGNAVQSNEFLFSVKENETASFVIEIEQNAGTTYLSDIEMFEADATVLDWNKQLRFEYNDSDMPKIISLDATYVGVDGKEYQKAVTIPAFSSIILTRKSWKY